MFQRLKGAIDSRIAEEQARQRQAQLAASPQRPQQRRRPQGQNGSAGRVSSRQRDPGAGANERGPDPSEFEPEFAIGEDDSAVPSRSETPKPEVKETREAETQPAVEGEREGANSAPDGNMDKGADTNGSPAPQAQSPELPTDVRVKLRKLERLEAKYGDLLRAYRVAHARVQIIEPFEATLREHTPLTSINDPGALIEYLGQINVKSDMVLEELKRVSGERDDFKKKSEQAEDNASQLRVELTELKKQVDEKGNTNVVEKPATDVAVATSLVAISETAPTPQTPPSPAPAHSPTPSSSRITSFSLFSPRVKAASPPPKEVSEDFFSYDSEVPRLEAEVQQRQTEIDELKKQVQNLKGDLAIARESTEGMVQTLESATRELHNLCDAKDKFDATKIDLEEKIAILESTARTDTQHSKKLQTELDKLRSENLSVSKDLGELKQQVSELEKAKVDLEEQLEARRKETNILNEKLYQKDSIVKDLEDSLAMAKSAARQEEKQRKEAGSSDKELATMQGIMNNLRSQLDHAERTVTQLKKDMVTREDDFEKRPSSKVFGFLDPSSPLEEEKLSTREDIVNYLAANFGLRKDTAEPGMSHSRDLSIAPSEASTAPPSKKKPKKKKKGKAGQAANEETELDAPVKVSEDLANIEDPETQNISAAAVVDVSKLEQEIAELKAELESKSSSIDRLSKQLKDEEALKEEIETLRDDLLHQGEEHVEARDALKTAESDRKALRETVEGLEKELAEARKTILSGAESDKSHKEALEQLNELKTRSTTLQTDLSASEQLASARFKDITDLRELLSKAQPEMRNLRNEVADLKSAKEDFKNKAGELSRLEARHEDLKAEMKGLSKRLGDKDSEIKELQKKIEQETTTRTRLEEELRSTQSDLRTAEARRLEAVSTSNETSKELAKSKEEAVSLKKQLRALEDQLSTHTRQVSELKEEISIKTALHGSAQSLVQSLRDQTHELSTQARESSTRAENLEEEFAEAQRMLSERTREGQTMRMLLNQTETGTEVRIREMKERMDAAIEERDRVEDEASVGSRRMMREVEDAKSRARDAQRSLKLLEDEKEELESRQREWKRRREELEQVSERATKEVEDVRAAMARLREALDESERQVREMESQKAELRKAGDDAKERVEKLTKANKNLAEELKMLKPQSSGPRKGSTRPGLVDRDTDSGVQSSRTSIDSSNTRSPVPPRERPSIVTSSSTPRSETPTSTTTTGPGGGGGVISHGSVDYVYLKNVLLQFLEQKDKGHQRQLIPVLGMLLHFDRKDEQKWISAISAR